MSPQPWRRVTRAEANKGRLKTSNVRAGKPLAFGSLPLRRYVDSRRAADAPIAQPTGIPRGRGRVMTRGGSDDQKLLLGTRQRDRNPKVLGKQPGHRDKLERKHGRSSESHLRCSNR